MKLPGSPQCRAPAFTFEKHDKISAISEGGTYGYRAVERKAGGDTGSPAALGKLPAQIRRDSGNRTGDFVVQRFGFRGHGTVWTGTGNGVQEISGIAEGDTSTLIILK